jgi:hypothetical protein
VRLDYTISISAVLIHKITQNRGSWVKLAGEMRPQSRRLQLRRP